MEFIMYTLTLT